ncbi:MAG: helix-turn-helix transcriptional regulator [Clostridia bacterium]|nr:helix-turn-helix transcriptional regulator [Clostridia bacterium]
MNNRNAIEVLEHKKQSTDDLIANLTDISYGISQDSTVRNLAINVSEVDASNRMDFFNIMEKSKRYVGVDSNFENVFIYFNKADYIASYRGNADSGQYYDFYYTDRNMSKSEWYSILSSNHYGELMDFSLKSEGEKKGNMLFLYSLYGSERFKPYATIAIEIPRSNFFLESSDKYSKSKFLAVDDKQNIVIADKNVDMEFAEEFLKKNKLESGITDYGSFVVVSVPSDDGSLTYLDIITKDYFKKDINRSRMVIIICNILCLGVLSWLIFVLNNRNYRPVKHIIDIFNDGEQSVEQDEFQYINSKISDMIEENKDFNQSKQKQDEMLKELFLLKLLSNSALPKNKDELFAELGIFMPYKDFMCMLFCIEMNEDMFFVNNKTGRDTDYELAKFALMNILNEKLEGKCFNYYCEIDGNFCMISNLCAPEHSEMIFNVICELQEFVLKKFNIKFSCGISRIHETFDNISLCYNEARECVSFRFFEGKQIIKYEEGKHIDNGGYYYPFNQEKQLVRMIKISDVEGAIKLLDELFDVNITELKISPSKSKYFLLALANTIEENFDLNEERITAVQELKRVIEKEEITFSSAKQEIYNAVINTCGKFDGEKLYIDDMIERIKEYINNNYSDPDLNVNTMALKFGITASYLSTVFKKNNVIGLKEYIISVRMERAKSILSITDYTVDKVAVMVGYTNSRSFSRAFLKYEGISPGKYKEMNCEDLRAK